MKKEQRIIAELQEVLKLKSITYEITHSNYESISGIAYRLGRMLLDYGITPLAGYVPIKSGDSQFNSEIATAITDIKAIPFGGSVFRDNPLNLRPSEVISLLKSGYSIEVEVESFDDTCTLKHFAHFKINGKDIFTFRLGGVLTQTQTGLWKELVTNLFLYPSKFKVLDENGTPLLDGMNHYQIAWYMAVDFRFDASGSSYNIRNNYPKT